MLAFVEAIERPHTVTIDGYTSNKTINGIIKDVARAVAKYDAGEAELLRSFLTEDMDEYNNPFIEAKHSGGGYFFEIESVECASSLNEETDEIEYKEGYHTYFCFRFVR